MMPTLLRTADVLLRKEFVEDVYGPRAHVQNEQKMNPHIDIVTLRPSTVCNILPTCSVARFQKFYRHISEKK